LARCFDGDVSDAIPGVTGVGLKTLSKKFPRLSTEEVQLEEILNESRELAKNSKLKMYKSIAESEDLLKLNWRLMNLDLTSLSATQVKKIEDGIRVEVPQSNKMGLMRTLMQNGVKTFNVDSLFLQINANLVDKQ